VQYAGLAPGGQDLVIQYRIHPDPIWHRNGLDLVTEQSVNIWDMVLGGDVSVRTLTGDQLITTMPPRTQPRTMLRLRRQGLKDSQGRQGDILVRVNPVIPKDIAPEIEEAIRNHRK
jgi:molecular chaperone DnaJ